MVFEDGVGGDFSWWGAGFVGVSLWGWSAARECYGREVGVVRVMLESRGVGESVVGVLGSFAPVSEDELLHHVVVVYPFY